MTKAWIFAFVLVSGARAQPAIAPPRLGFVEDGARALRPAYGVAGNFLLGPPIAGKVVSAAFSGSVGLLKTDSSLAVFDSQGKLLASMDTAPGPALFAFSPSGAALASIGNVLVEWRDGLFVPLVLNDEEVMTETPLAIAFPNPFEASFLVQRKEIVWQVDFSLGRFGAVSQRALVGVLAPVLALPSGELVYRDANGIVIRRTDASEAHVAAALPADFSLQQMNQDWVQLTDLNSTARFAIRTTPGREGFYQLPESNQ